VQNPIIQVVPEDLHLSARFIECHAKDIEAQHGAAHAEIESALPGLVGISAAAIAEKAVEWQGVTQAMCLRLSGHGAAFTTSAVGYQTTDDHNATEISRIGSRASHTAWT
jgi:hypothetical protein